MKIKKIETNFKAKLFLHETNNLSFKEDLSEMQVINVYPDLEYDQTIYGFGAAFTEASGYAFSRLPSNKKEQLIQDCFSKSGLNYTLGRLPIASCDFSISSYSYAYDKALNSFSVRKDEKYIVPLIKEAQKASSSLRFLASPWSPPAFMKDNKQLTLGRKITK